MVKISTSLAAYLFLFTACLMLSQVSCTNPNQTDVGSCLLAISSKDANVGKYASPEGNPHNDTPPGRRLDLSEEDTSVVVALLKYYFSLDKTTQDAIKACNPDSKGAIKRCEKQNGNKNCEEIGPGIAAKKCTGGLQSYNGAVCAEKCPSGFYDRVLDCYKPEAYKVDKFVNELSCKENGACQRYALSFWVPDCKPFFVRVGADYCVPQCPGEWMDLGRKCVKPKVLHNGALYTWTPEDK